MRRTILAALAALLLALPGDASSRPFVRGVVVSCPRWGPIWGSEAMAESLSELAALGVEWVAIHPYGWLRSDGSVESRPAAELDFLEKAVAMARQASVELFWKPHLGYWGTFSHRGAIDFGEDPAAWARFFREYESFIVDQARFAEAAGVRLFAVGVELDRTTRYEDLWRRIIARVRAVYSGRIVYAANWDRLDAVPFWDAVDLIGVHAYFPLSEAPSPSRAELESSWDDHLAALEARSKGFAKPVLFAEIGYNLSPDAARTPWAYATERTSETRELRRLLLDVAMERIEASPAVAGMFWWKWMPGSGARRGNFSMREPEALAALREHWGPRPPRATTAR
jgi:hypothetical protein